MARTAADLYVTEVELSESGAVQSRKFLAGYGFEAAKRLPGVPVKIYYLEITQQTFSAAQRRGNTCITRVIIPPTVEVSSSPTTVSRWADNQLVTVEEGV